MPTMRVCLQWSAVLFNTFTLIIGCLAALAGAYELLYQLDEGFTDHIDVNKIIQLTTAGILILAAIIGCTGAFLGSIKVLVVHMVLLVLLIGAHVWRLAHYNESKYMDATEVFVMDIWMKELSHPNSMQTLQHRYKCCGNKGFSDYTSLHMKVPYSCFHTEDGLHALYPYPEGCMTAVKRVHLNIYRYEMWTHCGLIGYEIVSIILAITLSCQLTTKTRRYAY
ncbi:protein late bloomer [Drosophila grimshawi]|uniref:GH10375 n=1 Tax=Drosophila grimshawi TaxID=7222 RepID=B4J3Y0_DROGR|nr:protein late bloomer [Drosophila grimshawi]EDW01563.1 GH21510 [Drosophila grimshawi]EDW04999.1 GH10375 [Drosophila grimshawi]